MVLRNLVMSGYEMVTGVWVCDLTRYTSWFFSKSLYNYTKVILQWYLTNPFWKTNLESLIHYKAWFFAFWKQSTKHIHKFWNLKTWFVKQIYKNKQLQRISRSWWNLKFFKKIIFFLWKIYYTNIIVSSKANPSC